MNQTTAFQAFAKRIQNPVKARLFLLFRLPSAYFSGVRIRAINDGKCEVTVPYRWFTRNPFRSTYFACLAMAAELSTGALAMGHLYRRQPSVSMLVLNIEGRFVKKATRRTRFTCLAGEAIREAIEKAASSGEPQILTAVSTGTNPQGETVAEFSITWSFKARQEKPA